MDISVCACLCQCRVCDDLTCLSSTVRPQAKLHVLPLCVCARLLLCERAQTSRSAEVRLVMALLCLVGTAAAVTFTNAMNQRQKEDRPADQKTTNYTVARLTPGGQGRERERWRCSEHTPRTNKQQRTRAQTDRGSSGLQRRHGDSKGRY